MGVLLEHIYHHVNTLRQPFEEEDEFDEVMTEFPVTSADDVQLIENKLKDDAFFTKVVKALKSIGKFTTLSMTVKNAMNKILSPQVGMTFSYKGRSGKKPAFLETSMHKVVFQSVRKLYKKKVENNEILHWMQNWVEQCSSEVKRKKAKEEKQRRAEEAQILLEDDDDDDYDDDETEDKDNESE
ncbi:uncharacterized protein LOC122512002 [Leptopilina heterotoma]|uniref:uncharacterized protein LOC122512002 n=1 Tax=Leptopilina heterotoma TaxID=63436 RepID=UPI001CA87CBB|nr:uncharacterized protein LOC122512002 [Leptopilina heterotoma]